MRSGGPAICLSTVVVGQSHLLEKSGPGLLSKKIDGTFLSLEWERFVAVVCSVFGHSEMQAQISVTNLTFATRSEPGGAFILVFIKPNRSPKFHLGATNKSQPTGMFGAAPSPASLSPFKRKADNSSSSVKLVLDPNDIGKLNIAPLYCLTILIPLSEQSLYMMLASLVLTSQIWTILASVCPPSTKNFLSTPQRLLLTRYQHTNKEKLLTSG